MKKRRSRRLLQVSLGICATVPIVTGLLGMAGINNPIYDEAYKPSGVLLDSNLRFLNGLSVASYGLPPSPFNIVVFSELATPPLLVYWQSRISG